MLGRFLFAFISIISMATPLQASLKAAYSVSFPEPQTHYIEVALRLEAHKNKPLNLKMPVWTPGSYLVREFSRHIESVQVSENASVKKLAKNHWQIVPNENGEVLLRYKVYAFELSVRTSFVDADMAVISNASVFLSVDSKERVTYEVQVQPYAGWKQINSSLAASESDKWKLYAGDFDELADSPILIGNQKVFQFEVKGVPHTVAMSGKAEYDVARLTADMQKVCNAAADVIGEHPCKNYTFLIVSASGGSGGLEHANSCLLHTARTSFTNEGQYKNFLGLVAHEYFHLWNVKRIRPVELGPFDYDNENYTSMLWLSEGFTSYYDDLICQRAGVITADRLLEISGSNINTVENMPGSQIQSVSESSFDAWIKYYRGNENSNNSTTNYYSKGAILGLLLDLEIISATKGEKNLDQLMRNLYANYYKKQGRGFTEAEFQKEAEALTGKSLQEFFDKYVNGTEPIFYNSYFSKAGLKLANLNEGKLEIGLGAGISNSGGRFVVGSVTRNSPAWKYGLNVNDEIIALDNYRVTGDINQYLASKDAGDTVNVLLSRDGIIRELSVKLDPVASFSYRLEKLPVQEANQLLVYKKWLGIR